jgi:hypothetical protein
METLIPVEGGFYICGKGSCSNTKLGFKQTGCGELAMGVNFETFFGGR